jgi:hypothetical protein
MPFRLFFDNFFPLDLVLIIGHAIRFFDALPIFGLLGVVVALSTLFHLKPFIPGLGAAAGKTGYGQK